MRYRAIQEHDRRVPIRLMCQALAVSAARYDVWRTRPENQRSVRNRALLSEYQVLPREFRETYGSPSIGEALIKRGHDVGEHQVARLMRQDGLRAKTVKPWRAPTLESPIARGREHPQSPVHGRISESGVGRGPHLPLDRRRLALSCRGP